MFSFVSRVILRQIPRVSNFSTVTIKQNVNSQKVPIALRSKKPKSNKTDVKYFVDSKYVRTLGGKGGDGNISFLKAWCNEMAGPDGGDGGNGGHVVFEATYDVNNLGHVTAILKGEHGEKGYNRDMHGKNAIHNIVKVPVGTIVRNPDGKIVGDLGSEGLMFVAARGGAGGKGNVFFLTDTEQAPQISEYGGEGEDLAYSLELRSMAHVGLIGLPNAGKSTLLRLITRARPKVASYAFTTLKPHLGMVQYDDFEQIAVADLPGLIPGSHKNKGLGIQFLKHAERCRALIFIIDVSSDEPWLHYEALQIELNAFSPELITRPQVIVANKVDLPNAEENLKLLRSKLDIPIIPISAKMGTNVSNLLQEIRIIYDKSKDENKSQ